MKEKTKDMIVEIGGAVLTLGTSLLAETVVGYGTVALLNHVFKGTWTKAQIKAFSSIVFTGSVGVAALTAKKTHDEFIGMMQELMDTFPTDKEDTDG